MASIRLRPESILHLQVKDSGLTSHLVARLYTYVLSKGNWGWEMDESQIIVERRPAVARMLNVPVSNDHGPSGGSRDGVGGGVVVNVNFVTSLHVHGALERERWDLALIL